MWPVVTSSTLVRRAAFVGALGVAGTAGTVLGTVGVAQLQSAVARRIADEPFEGAPDDSGVYGDGDGRPYDVLVLGDSTARGMGADVASQTIGAAVAATVHQVTGRAVRLSNVASVSATSPDLVAQTAQALAAVPAPDVALVLIGANDVTESVVRATSVRHLAACVSALRAVGAQVVVGTCPDLATIEPVPEPLHTMIRKWSRDLAAAQTVGVIEHGGRTVSLGDLLGHEHARTPSVMFAGTRSHPSAAGYARAASALIPSVLDALGIESQDTGRAPDRRRGESIGPVKVIAARAVRDPGTEVSATRVGGASGGHQGAWAVLLRRHRRDLPATDVDASIVAGAGSPEGAAT